jgi:glycosyltransferase involved in cell wall biosynthesis
LENKCKESFEDLQGNNKMKNKISVVLLTYNSRETIEKCLNSLKDQTNRNFDILIVDDNSTDNTLEIIKKKEKDYFLNITYLKNGKHNISIGRNIGIKNAKTDYVAFLDSDAYADKNWIKNILSAFNKDKTLALIGGKALPIYSNKFSYAISITYKTISDLTRKGLWQIGGCNFVIDKSKLKNIYFDEQFIHCEDAEYSYRLEKMNKKYTYDPLIKVNHEGRSNPKAFFIQQYKYGIWELFFNFYSKKKIRLLALFPAILIISTIIFSFLTPYFLLALPFICFLESILVLLYNREKIFLFPEIFLGWLIKNVGWGLGTIKGFIEVLFKSKRYKLLFKK